MKKIWDWYYGKASIRKKSFEEWYANQSKYHNDDKEVIDDV